MKQRTARRRQLDGRVHLPLVEAPSCLDFSPRNELPAGFPHKGQQSLPREQPSPRIAWLVDIRELFDDELRAVAFLCPLGEAFGPRSALHCDTVSGLSLRTLATSVKLMAPFPCIDSRRRATALVFMAGDPTCQPATTSMQAPTPPGHVPKLLPRAAPWRNSDRVACEQSRSSHTCESTAQDASSSCRFQADRFGDVWKLRAVVRVT